MSLTIKVLILFIAISLAPLLMVTILWYTTMQDTLTTQMRTQLEEVTLQQANKIESFLLQRKELVSDFIARNSVRTHVEQTLQGKEKESELLAFLNTIQKESSIILSITILSSDFQQQYSTTEKNKALLDYAKTMVSEQKTTMLVREDDRVRCFTIASINLEGEKHAYLFLETNTEALLSVVKDYDGLGESGEIAVFQKLSNGDVLFLLPLRNDVDAALKRVISANTPQSLAIHATTVEELFSTTDLDYRGKRVLSFTKTLTGESWIVGAKVDYDEIFSPIKKIQQTIMIITSMLLILIIIIAIYVSGTIGKPIQQLTIAAQKLSQGVIDKGMLPDGTDEIGTLSETFFKMATNILDSKKELENRINERTKTLNEKLAELEKMNQLMVGRELQMVELKKQLEQLQAKQTTV